MAHEVIKVSEMPVAGSLGPADLLMVVKGGINMQAPVSVFKSPDAEHADTADTAVHADTATPGNISTLIANTAFVAAAIDAFKAWLIGSAPEVMNQIDEISAALANDPNFYTTMMTALAGKAAIGHNHDGTYVTLLEAADIAVTKTYTFLPPATPAYSQPALRRRGIGSIVDGMFTGIMWRDDVSLTNFFITSFVTTIPDIAWGISGSENAETTGSGTNLFGYTVVISDLPVASVTEI